eukprot:1162142-Pelagomonas_calceolata.AAC.9
MPNGQQTHQESSLPAHTKSSERPCQKALIAKGARTCLVKALSRGFCFLACTEAQQSERVVTSNMSSLDPAAAKGGAKKLAKASRHADSFHPSKRFPYPPMFAAAAAIAEEDAYFKDIAEARTWGRSLLVRAESIQQFNVFFHPAAPGGGKDLEEVLAVRPTSETMVNHMLAQWIQAARRRIAQGKMIVEAVDLSECLASGKKEQLRRQLEEGMCREEGLYRQWDLLRVWRKGKEKGAEKGDGAGSWSTPCTIGMEEDMFGKASDCLRCWACLQGSDELLYKVGLDYLDPYCPCVLA